MASHKNNYADLLSLMRKQGAKDNPTTLLLGIMQSENSLRIGELLLTSDDIYIASDLLAGYKRELVNPYIPAAKLSGDTESTNTSNQNVIEYKTGLEQGDLVAVMKLYNCDAYVILAKVVQV